MRTAQRAIECPAPKRASANANHADRVVAALQGLGQRFDLFNQRLVLRQVGKAVTSGLPLGTKALKRGQRRWLAAIDLGLREAIFLAHQWCEQIARIKTD